MIVEHYSAQLSFFRNSNFWNFLSFFLGHLFFENYLSFWIRACGTILSAFNTAQQKFSFPEKTKWWFWDFFKNYVFFENDSQYGILVYGTFLYVFRATQHKLVSLKTWKYGAGSKIVFWKLWPKFFIFSRNGFWHNRALISLNSAQLLFFWKLKMAVLSSGTFSLLIIYP